MKLRIQILGLGLVGLIMALLVGGIGVLNTSRLAGAFDQSVDMSVALQNSQEADMMHDAVRGDVLLALLGTAGQDAAMVADAQKGIKEHGATFNKALTALHELPISAEVQAMLQKTVPMVQKYVEAADLIIKTAATDDKAAQAMVPAFQKAFGELEQQMSEQGEAIEKDTKAFQDEAKESVASTRIKVGIALAVAAAILIFASLTLARQMTHPMVHAVEVADQLARGNLAVKVQAQGNAETQQLLNAMARMQASFGGIVHNVKAGAESVATASAEIAQGNNDLSARTEQQASALEETAASMEELGSTVKQNADSARTANQLAMSASSVAVQGGVVVNQVVETMKGINESSRKISDIISVIDGIAFQTNILALNAAVEAARAGEQGRGFAVVASEVRSLAGRSAEAAKEIKTLIGASVERVEYGSALVDQAGTTMTEVVDSIKRVTDIMGEISAASNEQSLGVAQVGEAVSQMDQTTQQNAALVEEMAAAASSLKGQAEELVQTVAIFQLADGHQVPAVKPAGTRSPQTNASAFKGSERRSIPASSNASKTSPKPAAAKVASPALPKPAPKTSAKATPAAGDDDWETF